jgi:hypothetical protein
MAPMTNGGMVILPQKSSPLKQKATYFTFNKMVFAIRPGG